MIELRDHVLLDEPCSGLQRLAAEFHGHAYDPHRHETYAIGVTLWGAQAFRYRAQDQTSAQGQTMVIHPDEHHDGHAAAPTGFGYHMIYVEPALIGAALRGTPPPFVPQAVAFDQPLVDILDEAFADFPAPLEPLAVNTVIGRLADALSRRSDSRPARCQEPTALRPVNRMRDLLVAESSRTISSVELEKLTGLDRFTLARHFRAAFGTSPHRFQIGQRLLRARRLISNGIPLAAAAASAGFADQSHLTRHFLARFGVTPGRWAGMSRRQTVSKARRSLPDTGR